MSTSYVLGADPGKHGAVVLVDSSANPKAIRPDQVILIPTRVTDGHIDVVRLIADLRKYADSIVLAVQEKVLAIFGCSASSTFGFGGADDALRATLELLGLFGKEGKSLTVHRAAPKIWQHVAWAGVDVVSDPVIDKKTGVAKLLKSGKPRVKVDTKATSLKAAMSLFPGVNFVPTGCRVIHDGLIDAALIAHYALCKYQG